MRKTIFVIFLVSILGAGALGTAEVIHVPADIAIHGNVLIAEQFYKTETINGQEEQVPLPYRVWPGPMGMRNSNYFDVRLEAHPGDVIMLAAGKYRCDVWVYTPGVTITTDPQTTGMADIWGTVEIDADDVTLDGIAVTGPRKTDRGLSSGHGIELNREVINKITIRNCRSADNDWTGIHIIGPRGEIDKLRVENCQLVNNGMDGMDAQSVHHLIITGCTITGNGRHFDHGVGVRIGSFVDQVTMKNNVIENNRFANVYRKGH